MVDAGSALSIDGLRPARVATPTTAAQVAEALRAAAEAHQAVIPVGGGRALGIGDVPERFDVALMTRGLDRILELSPADLTCSVEAGVTLEELNEELGKAGQFLPWDPAESPGHTVGGALAAALAGPLRQRYGPPRDFVIGLRVALSDGRLAASGGRVVKNVSGYDLNKLHLGALGTLGVIVAASFKTFPRPLCELSLETHPAEPWSAARHALGLRMPPAALELTKEGRLCARLEGTREGVARMGAELGWEAAGPEVWSHGPVGCSTWARISVPPARLRRLLDALPESGRWWAWPGVGVAHWVGDLDREAIIRTREAAEAAGGSAILLRAPLELKRRIGAWGTPPPTLEWMRRLKQAFDPSRTLNPGRYLV